ncbi:MAG: PhnD/SsuA/transferrin family substrate-binding protein [Candidatus Thiodiazotropha sp.]
MTTHAGAAPLPERYQGDLPDIGYFGRMEKVLYSADAKDTTIVTNVLIKEIFGQMGMKSEVKLYLDVEKLKQDLSNNYIDAVFINVFDYFTMEHLLNTDYIYTIPFSPNIHEKTLLITPKKDHISKVDELRGKSISIPSGHFHGNYFLDVELLKRGLPQSTNFFARIEEVNDINTAVIDLFFGKTDCALVTDVSYELAAELNKQIPKNLEILLSSNDIVPQIIAMNKNIPISITQKVNSHLIKANENPRIKNLLSLFQAQKFVKLNKSQILESRRLFSEYQAIMK